MRLYKCDRCSTLFEHKAEEIATSGLSKEEITAWRKFAGASIEIKTYPAKYKDLCNACVELLIIWLGFKPILPLTEKDQENETQI